ncbi:hypothetical protein K466DRAFT_586080 [Polyporus arcularius HHB13444]|uniref:Uncharacterized protein n=1 Tax=Polyporus arcularius HHB13444 TaxID=1314778 RepID=A0A5C3PDJ0_9APHY|nr:hypothetical protein K466DRAFT_586080 [Polyporus arcularius HHB13444]
MRDTIVAIRHGDGDARISRESQQSIRDTMSSDRVSGVRSALSGTLRADGSLGPWQALASMYGIKAAMSEREMTPRNPASAVIYSCSTMDTFTIEPVVLVEAPAETPGGVLVDHENGGGNGQYHCIIA